MEHQQQLDASQSWQFQDRFLELHSAWLTLMGEHWLDDQGNPLEYWRIEKADSVIILPIQDNHLLLPQPSYRPGIGQVTLDFPGGRVPTGSSPADAAVLTLQRELGIEATDILELSALNPQGWAVNSAFSNQHLYGFVAEVQTTQALPSKFVFARYPRDESGVRQLAQSLSCLQCRALLLAWWFDTGSLRT